MSKEIINDNSGVTANSKQVEVIKKHFPQCFDEHGKFMPHILQDIVGDGGVELSKESYSLNWLGKSYARLLANENPRTWIAEDKVHNQKPENQNSENLLIKGDNLEVLKHLVNAYSEKVKMIYIDPPYNTGSDGFVYQDDRKFTVDELSRLAGIDKDEARRILDFTQSKANSHSAWLTFMYPRLYVGRELLSEDGVIFISIDDHEVSQLKLLCDSIFGEENFMGSICRATGQTTGQDSGGLGSSFDYILVYGRNAEFDLSGLPLTSKDLLRFDNEDYRGKYAYDQMRKTGSNDRREDRPNLFYPVLDPDGHEVWPIAPAGYESCWRFGKDTYDSLLDNDFILWKKTRRGEKEVWWPYVKYYAEGRTKRPSPLWNDLDGNKKAARDVRTLFEGKKIFDFPKPVSMVKRCIQIAPNSSEDDIILDFFAGSGTTAQAVMELNVKGSHRKFISIQLPEPTDKKKAAFNEGYKTIFDITKARIEKAANQIRAENPEYEGNLGFKVYNTLPIPEGYLDDIENLAPQQALFDGSKFDGSQLEALLTTWKVYDGIALTQTLDVVELGDYLAWYFDKNVYLLRAGFTTEALKALIEKLDGDKAFSPAKVVLFGYNFSSKHQREIKEALGSYANKKSIDVDVTVRY